MSKEVNESCIWVFLVAHAVPINHILHTVLGEEVDGVILEAIIEVGEFAFGSGIDSEFVNVIAFVTSAKFGRVVSGLEKSLFNLSDESYVLFTFLCRFL